MRKSSEVSTETSNAVKKHGLKNMHMEVKAKAKNDFEKNFFKRITIQCLERLWAKEVARHQTCDK